MQLFPKSMRLGGYVIYTVGKSTDTMLFPLYQDGAYLIYPSVERAEMAIAALVEVGRLKEGAAELGAVWASQDGLMRVRPFLTKEEEGTEQKKQDKSEVEDAVYAVTV